MASREQIENLAQKLLTDHGHQLDTLRDAMFRLIDASSAEANPRPTEPIAVASPERDGVLCVVSAVCVAASEGQPITLIATRVSAVDRDEEDVTPTEAEALSFSRALLGENWFIRSFRDRHEVADAARPSRGVRLYLSSDFQPGIPEVLGDSLVPTTATID
jgi:hypothetical protein